MGRVNTRRVHFSKGPRTLARRKFGSSKAIPKVDPKSRGI